ncbi:MAG: hypothetical protein AAF664_07610 [Planctomycetota bacterium]
MPSASVSLDKTLATEEVCYIKAFASGLATCIDVGTREETLPSRR